MYDPTRNDTAREDVPRARARIKSFSRRGGRMIRRYEEGLERHGEAYVLDIAEGDSPTTIAEDARVDLREAFGREAPLIVEVGPGSGEQMLSYAAQHPDHDVLAFEAWHVAVARCVTRAAHEGITNIRLVEADAAQAIPVIFGWEENPRAVQMWTFFPDPWRKSRHRKRRLVAAPFIATAHSVLAPAGLWRLATDWDDYAWQMRDEIEGSGLFTNLHAGERPDSADPEPDRGGFAPRWDERIMTRFERRGIEAGRTIHDFTFARA